MPAPRLECAPDNSTDNLGKRSLVPKGYIRAARRSRESQEEKRGPEASSPGRRKKGPSPAPSAHPDSMDTKGSFCFCFSLAFLLCFQRSAAHPIDSLSPAKELASMEALLERLEEKVSLMEDLRNSPEFEEPETQGGSLVEFSDNGDEQQLPDPRVNPPTFLSDRSSLLKHMRGLQAAKSMRDSGCFGRRLDRIGSVSGMGCKGSRRH